MTIVSVVGARPQLVKAAVISRALKAYPSIRHMLIHTGQHYDDRMSSIFFDDLDIPQPDYNLGIGSGSHGYQTGRMIEDIERVLLADAPDWLLAYGDTNSTIAGALAAAKLHIPVAHIEAGLRSFNREMPEEINRILTDHISDLLFAPTEAACANLQREGIDGEKVRKVGDVMYDAMLHYSEKARETSRILECLGLTGTAYVLCTVHRAENTDHVERLSAILGGLRLVAQEIPVIFPVHPRTVNALEGTGLLDAMPTSFHIIQPIGYLDMINLESHAALIVTDSGGVQKEAYFHHVSCVTLRTETEWVELIENGWNRLVPPGSPDVIYAGIRSALRAPKGTDRSFYGDGKAGIEIIGYLIDSTFSCRC